MQHSISKTYLSGASCGAAEMHADFQAVPIGRRRQFQPGAMQGGDVAHDGQALLLHELLANLVDNALRYTPQGGSVILRVRAAQPGQEHGAVLEVEDSGKGIPPAERERVFTPFYRVGTALESNPGGAGLGLAIVRDIAALHGARLELATAANGHGLKVSVQFSGTA